MKTTEQAELSRIVRTVLATTAAICLLNGSAITASAGPNPNPGVIPPDSTYRGLTYGEWGAQWWSAVFSVPIVDGAHPYFNGGAVDGDKGVVFLAGTAGGAVIDVTVSAGTPILVPVLNAECSVVEPDPFHGDDEAELRACANGHLDQTSGHFAAIDGVPVENLDAYRSESPLFTFTLPDNNVLGAPGGTTSLSVDAGIYLLLAPLSKGVHTIEVGGTFDEFDFTIDATFRVTVK